MSIPASSSFSLNQDEDGEVQIVTILHVEDNEIVAGMAKEMLETRGWTVDRCTDGIEALERLSGNAPYDLLLFDYDLPGLTGLELIAHVRGMFHRRYLPIVMMSGTLDEATALDAGADAFLRKPQDVGLLAETISQLLGERKEKPGDI